MKQYTIHLSQYLLPLLNQASKYAQNTNHKQISYTITEEKKKDSFLDETKVIIEAEDDDSFFNFGYFLERCRDEHDMNQQDLRDKSRLYVEVPDAFLLICKFYDLLPSQVLRMFAGDLCRHPFITGGSDERMMASEYFMRGNFLNEEKQKQADNLFEDLWCLRHGWRSDRAEEYREEYREMLKALEREYITGQPKEEEEEL
jgi:hypothetical protein